MILKLSQLERIVTGEVRLVFRRWHRPSARAGRTLVTALGVLEIDLVEATTESAISEADARHAGYTSRAQLLSDLGERDGTLYRVELRFAGPDPRVRLRADADLSASAVSDLRQKLERFDATSRVGPWSMPTLRLIRERPAVLAARLASQLGLETAVFKRNVRKLKELGLTESLEVGYRLSPRGAALLQHLDSDAIPPARNR